MRHVCFVLVVLALSPLALAWNATGHKTVAAIAWDNMTPKAQERAVAELLESQAGDCLHEMFPTDSRPLKERQREFFIMAATWPDVVRPKINQQTKKPDDKRPCIQFHQPDWHFLDHYWTGVSGGTGSDAPKDDPAIPIKLPNEVGQMELLQPVVAGTCPSHLQALYLAWIEHLVGDTHQPLHNAGRVTSEPNEQTGDQGGNLFLLKKEKPTDPSNLHSLWDNIIDESVPRNTNESDLAYVTRVSHKIEQDHPKNSVGDLKPGKFEEWSKEGFETAKKIAYPATLQRNQTASATYMATVFDTCELALAKGGYRLANLFNAMFP
ncbi:MAG TPA: S1/P1 nuclease [Thermoanaerobaculia bacterium]|nr:S1/P1 nuclease [Thermoanaerobaculia bacterium]